MRFAHLQLTCSLLQAKSPARNNPSAWPVIATTTIRLNRKETAPESESDHFKAVAQSLQS